MFIWRSVEMAYRRPYGGETLWSFGVRYNVGRLRFCELLGIWHNVGRLRFCELLGIWHNVGRLRSCELLGIWHNVGRLRSCELLGIWHNVGRLRSCELLGIWHNVGEGEILLASGYMAQCWRRWDLVSWVCGTMLKEWDLVIFWVCWNMLGRVRSTDLLGVWDHLGGLWHCDILGVWHNFGEREEKLRLDRTSVLYRPLANLTDNKWMNKEHRMQVGAALQPTFGYTILLQPNRTNTPVHTETEQYTYI